MAELKSKAIVRWLLGCVLCFGGAMVWSLVAMWSAKWLERTLNAMPTNAEYHSILLRDHAEPIVHMQRVVNERQAITHHVGFTTLDGQPVSLEPGAEHLITSKNVSAYLFNFPQYFSSSGESTRLIIDSFGPWPWSQRTSYFGVTGQQGQHALSWFFLWPDHPGGTGYWVGYDIVTKRRVGYLGKSGLTASIPPIADQFPAWDAESHHAARIMGGDPNYYYSSHMFPPSGTSILSLNDVGSEVGVLFVTPRRDTIYVLNLTRGSVAAVRSDIPEGQLLGITARDFGHQSHPSVEHLATELILIWSDRLEFTTPTLQSLRTVMLPEELRNQSLTFAEQDGDTFVTSNFVFAYGRLREMKSVAYPLIWFDKSGTVTRRKEMTLPWNLGYEWDVEQFQTPLSLMPISLWRYAEIARSGRIPDDDDRYFRKPDEPMTWTIWWQCLRQIAHRLPWSIGLCAFSGVPFAIACWWRQRRVAASRFERLAWPALVYLFGLVGWIAFVCHREWPRRRATKVI